MNFMRDALFNDDNSKTGLEFLGFLRKTLGVDL